MSIAWILPVAAFASFPGGDFLPAKSAINYNWCDVFSVIQSVINFLAIIAVPIILLMLIVAGARYIIGASTGSEETIDTGKDGVAKAVFGLIIILAAYVIINTAIVAIVGTSGGTDVLTQFFNVTCNLPSVVGGPTQ